MRKILLEICACSPRSARAAMEGGADRVELCCALEVGGLTPSYAAIRQTVRELAIPVNVLIRPRPGDFLYNDGELDLVCEDIRAAAELGATGIVCGALDPQGRPDAKAMERMRKAAGKCTFTFHRAFDLCRNPFAALEELMGVGVDTVLTSGQAPTAEAGAGLLAELEKRAAGRIVVMGGCGLNAGNIARVAGQAGLRAVHLSARRAVSSPMRYQKSGVAMGSRDARSEYDYALTDVAEVAACRAALDAISE